MAERFGKVRCRLRASGKPQWRVDFGRYGKIHGLGGEAFESETQALAVLRAVQGEVARGTPKRQAVERWLPRSSATHRVERWLGLWLEDLRAQVGTGERSPSYLRELERWSKPGPHGYLAELGPRSVHDLDFTALRAWQAAFPLRGKAAWNVVAGLSAFLGWLAKREVIAKKPPIPWPRYDEHVPAIVRPEVQDRILVQIPAAAHGVFLAMALLGLRHSEAWALDGRDYRDGRLWIRKARKGRALSSPLRAPKNRRPRVRGMGGGPGNNG